MSDAQRSGGSSRDVVEVATAEMRERIPEVERFLIPADALTLDGVTLPSRAALVGFRGREAVSALYRFDVLFSLPRGVDIEMRELLSTRITLGVAGDGPTPVKLHGIVAELQLLEAMPERAYYRAVMVPEAWHLGLSAHSRIFTEATVPQIIEAVLRNAGYETDQFELRLTESYPALEHVCQYRESDLTFLSRLMEKHGLYYFFEHGDTREKLVIIDDQSAHAPFTASATRFVPWGHDATRARQSGIDRFRCKVSALPSMVRLADYDPLRPQLMLRGDAAVSAGRGDVVLYGENLRTPDGGQRLARLRAQELLANETVYEGSGAGNPLRTGFTFELDEHPLNECNQSYFVTELEHFGVASGGSEILQRHLGVRSSDTYSFELRAVPADVQYRAPRLTPWPRIDGVVDGVVDGGADSQYAQIDEHGRYKVRVFFDESDLVDGSGSTWVRMLQPHGGGTEGMHFPLRKSTEVHMLFLGGDPDRPVIVGTAPNAQKPSKITSGNNTQNVLRSGSNNQLVMEDSAGGEYVGLSSPHTNSGIHLGAGGSNLVATTDGASLHNTGGSHTGTIGGTADETVGGAVTQSYGATHDLNVAGASTHTVGGTLEQTVSGAVTQTFSATQALTVGAAATHTYGATLDVKVAGALTQTVNGAAKLTFNATLDETVNAAMTLTVNGTTAEAHNASKSTTIAGSHALSAAGSQLIEGLGGQTLHGTVQEIAADGAQLLTSATHTVRTGTSSTEAGSILLSAGADVSVSAATVAIGAGATSIETGPFGLNAADIAMNGGAVHISGGGIVEISAGLIKLN